MAPKRYGYYFEKLDGTMTKSIHLRFWIVIYSFFAITLTIAYIGKSGFTNLYIALAFIYLLSSFLTELIPKVKNYPVLTVFLFVAYCFYADQGEMFKSSERVFTSNGWITQVNENTEIMIIYCAYNLFVALTALYGCIPKKNIYD